MEDTDAEKDTEFFLSYLAELEEAAEDILADKQQIVDLDRKRQKTREAARILQKDKGTQKKWVCFGDMFLKFPKDKTKQLLEKDFNQLDEEIAKIRKDLKPKVSKLRDLEHREDIKGFNLNPLSKQEMNALEQIL